MSSHRKASVKLTTPRKVIGLAVAASAGVLLVSTVAGADTATKNATCTAAPVVSYTATAANITSVCSIPLPPARTVTVTNTVPGPTKTVPGPTTTVPGPTVTVPGPTTTVTVTPPSSSSAPVTPPPASPSPTAPTAGGTTLETLGVSTKLSSLGGFSPSIESPTGKSLITPTAAGMQFFNAAGDKRTELGSSKSYGEGATIWVQQNTVLQTPWPATDADTNFMNWVAQDSSGFGADVQVASQASNGSNRLHAWIYPLGSATRTGTMNWNSALVYDAPLPAAGSQISVTLGLTLSSDPTKGHYELWVNGAKVASGTGRTMFTGSRVYGKLGVYGGPSGVDRSALVNLWKVTSARPF